MSSQLDVSSNPRTPSWLWTLILLGLGCWLMAVCWHEWLCDGLLAANFDSEGGRRWLIRRLKGRLTGDPIGTTALVPFENVLVSQIVFTCLWWFSGAAVLAGRLRVSFARSLLVWGYQSSLWWLLAGSWTVWHFLALVTSWTGAAVVISHLPEMWLSFASAGWMTTFVIQCVRWRCPTGQPATPRRAGIPIAVWAAVLTYTLIFGVMNTLLYNNLLVPHGDSAMYEEHLWNLLHGKGFRSFIDKGLFLGEHIQVIHLGLIPIYLFWPSHLLLEWCESLGLALGAIPVYLMTWRQTQCRWRATCLACAYLLYVPMQRLDISIDFKTFRPEAFGIPLLLASLNALDTRRWKAFGLWLFATLMVKEDYALIIGPLGLWIAVHEFRIAPAGTPRWRRAWPGIALAAGAVVYLWWAVKIAIPYFKAGNEVHYAKYFSQFGQTTNEIVYNLLLHPDWLARELFTPENFLFGAALCLSLALLPLWSPGRLAVGAPLFAALCLNQIARNTQHHFHAPLVAIVFWAAAHGLRNVQRVAEWWATRRGSTNLITADGVRFAVIMTLFASSGFHFWHALSPGGLPFWDTHSAAHWKRKYAPTARAAEFPKVLAEIPPNKRVASTDFVHPRFNHHERSYDYSGYRPDVPADVEYLVIDVQGPYSQVRSPADVAEFQKHPERWELLPDNTNGYFYVFQQRSASKQAGGQP
ncbi:MAG: DUF2079 domain-containing protein [Planctomycetota bacterium]